MGDVCVLVSAPIEFSAPTSCLRERSRETERIGEIREQQSAGMTDHSGPVGSERTRRPARISCISEVPSWVGRLWR